MAFFKFTLRFLALIFVLQNRGFSQCPVPSINAQAGTGASTTICSGQCVNLTATVVPPPNSTTNYSVAQITYSTFPYSGGSNAFATTLDDTWSDVINIGFNFCYFGNTYNKLVVGSNGEITFNLASANLPEQWVITQVLPNLVEHPPNTICGPYRDYDPLPGGVIRTYTTGVAPCRAFVMYWSAVTLFQCATPLSSFQIVLYESTNQIGVNIQNSTACLPWNGGRGLIGIQNGTGTFAVAPPARNTLIPWTAINESYRFTPTAAPVYSVNWAGPSGFSASGLTATPCPTATGNYTATMSYCSGSVSSVVQVLVNTPTLAASASSSTICPPTSVTLTGSGATSYTWQTPSASVVGATTVVSPTTTTTYTLLGANGACTSSTTIQITVNSAPTLSAFNLTGSVCSGNPVTLVGTGALTYTWYPGAVPGNIVTVTPTVTTTYTVVGTVGSCTGQATVIAPISNGPTLTTSSSPAAICPGGTSTLSASGALSYTWNPGATISSSIIVSPAVTTTYSVTGINALGCTSTSTISLSVIPVPNITISPLSPSVCIGSSATLTASGASTYTWNPSGLNGSSIVVSPSVTTTYTIIGSNGACTNSATSTLSVVPMPTVSASSSTASVCSGNSLTLTGSGATTYTWNPGNLVGSSVVVTPTITTTYTVTGSSGSCTNNAVVSVTVNNGPIITTSANPAAICPGNSSTLTALGALSYSWNPGALTGSSVVVSPAITTVYSVTGNNSFGCLTTVTLNLAVNPTPTIITAASSSTICIGSNATLTASGAATYTWNPGALTGPSVVVSPGLTTTYTVVGSNGTCTSSATRTITVVPVPTVSASSSTTSICAGGSATLTSTGAITYTWSPGSMTGSSIVITPTITTTYTVIGSSGSCTSSAMITLTVNNGPTLITSASPTAVCPGNSLTLTSTGAVSYTWNPGASNGSTLVVTPPSTTNYTVTGSTALGCTTTQTVSLTVNPNPTVSVVASSASVCIGSSATLTASGASTYSWMPGSLTGSNVVVSPASNTTYTVTGTSLGCSAQNTISINVVPAPTVSAISNPTVICNGSTATLTAGGAVTYTWMPGSLNGASVVVSPSVSTTYTVTGNNGACSASSTVALLVNPSPSVTASSSPSAICVSGNVTLTATGNATTYSWMPGSLTGTSVIVSPTLTTSYTLTGTSAFGCTNTAITTVTVNTVPSLSLAATPTVICNGSSSTLTALGANSYTWMPGTLTGSNVIVIPSLTTNYTVTGATGACSATGTLTVIVNPNPTVTASASPTNICAGNSSTLTASGAVTYTWNPGNLNGVAVSVTPSATTVYTVTGSTALECSNTTTVNLTVSPVPTITAVANPTAICNGNSSTLTASGASSYTWNPGTLTGSNVVVTPTINTTYTVTGITGICGNTQTVSVIVNPTPTINATASSPTICTGQSSSLTASGALSYTWIPGSLTGSSVVVSPIVSTIYTVTGGNSTGCSNTRTVSVTVNPLPTLNISATATNICSGGSATLTGSGATSYTWNPGAVTSATLNASPSSTTIYTLTGASGFGCTNTAMFTLSVTPTPTVNALANPTVICSGNSSTLSASGASSYTWNPGSLTGNLVVVSPTTNTTYTVTGANGICTNSQTVSIIIIPSPTLIAGASSSVICAGATTSLGVFGATSYTWNPGALTGSIVTVSPILTTTYTVTGTNSLGCTSNTTVIITVNPIPSLTITATSATICSGNSATLTGSGASNYTWNPGGLSGANITVSPMSTSTYSLIGMSAAGCTNTATFTLNVTPSPTLSAMASNTVICSGGSSTLTVTGATSYTWNPGALTGSNIIVSPIISTNYTVNGVNGSCSSSTVITVNVNSSPTITLVSNPAVLCSGSSATLTANGATSYTWMPSSANTSSIIVNPSITTTYTVTGSNNNGCLNTTILTLTVTTTPTVIATTSGSAICTNGSATLTGSGATSYTWMPGAVTGTSIIVTPSVSTTYTLNGITGNCSNTATVSITVNSLPVITAGASSSVICLGSSVSLTASGASTYTWQPGNMNGSSVTATPTINTTYTVSGTNTNGCSNSAIITVSVNPSPSILTPASPTSICVGGTSTLSASGASSYTWNPGSLNGNTISVSPSITTIYSVTGSSGIGCLSTQTVQLVVQPNPTVTIISSPTAVCLGGSATLTASGATTYTWEPGSLTGSVVIVTPVSSTIYSLTGANGVCGTGTVTQNVIVNPLPSITASVSNSITCTTPSVNLSATSSATNAGFFWNGPGGFTTAVQNPTGIAIPGNYTVNVVNLTTGCSSSTFVTITTDNSVPTLTANVSGTLTCNNPTATLSAASSATNATFIWNGPGSFTNSNSSFTTTTGGTYTITLTDLINNCQASTIVIVNSNTAVPITATIIPATCSGTMANNNGSILAGGFITGDKYDLTAGTSYTGTATYTAALSIPGSGVLINTLNNPTSIVPITVRFFGTNGCTKDITLFLTPTSCVTNTVFGIAKAVSTPTLKPNGTYDVNYFIVVKNTGTQVLNSITLNENLSATFPLPTTYSLISAPVVTSLNSSITINPAFNGSVQTVITNTTSKIAAGKTDTIMFAVNLIHNGNFGPFYNTVVGFSSPTVGVIFADSSNTGYNPDPDLNGNPTNNNIPTILTLTPNLFFGITKAGLLSSKLSDNTWDITYTITVHNLGNDTLRNVFVKDSLFNNTIKYPATYFIKSGPTATGNLSANASFNGNSDINLIVSTQSKIAPGAVNSIVFTINVNPDTVTIVKNSAFGKAVNTTTIVVSDTSNAGSNPDINNNGVWNEPADNVPTLISIPHTSLFIPAGFSPDGDGKNDLFVIKGLSSTIENSFTVYNRWGNKVYGKDNYDNSWNGYPNVTGTFGSERLPPGTYYYILELKNTDIKPMIGFIVIQY